MAALKHKENTKDKQLFIVTDSPSIREVNYYYYVEINKQSIGDTLLYKRMSNIDDIDMKEWEETSEYNGPMSILFSFIKVK